MSLTKLAESTSKIDPALYTKYDVKRGLRDINGKGVLAGLTDIGNVHAYDMVDGKQVPCEGKLYYRGYNIEDLVNGFIRDQRFGFEEVTYLLLFGKLPSKEDLKEFSDMLAAYRSLPTSFVRDIILKAPSQDMMNTLARSVLTLYTYDDRADDISLPNVLRQCLQLIALFPMLSVYGYQAYSHYHDGKSLYIHMPDPSLSTAENLLHILRPDSKYTNLEAHILDIALVLHMEHGGGNNSTFTTHVVSSSGTDTYSTIASSLGSLKGPKHGGANIKVVRMFEDMKKTVKDWNNEKEVGDYLRALLNKDAFDHAGLIYGMGHAVYSLSDPRANIFKGFVEKLSKEKAEKKSSSFILWWNALHHRSLPKNARSTKVSVPTWTSTADLYTVCWICLRSSSHRSLRSPVWLAGVPTASKSLPITEKLFVLHTKAFLRLKIMFRLKNVKITKTFLNTKRHKSAGRTFHSSDTFSFYISDV